MPFIRIEYPKNSTTPVIEVDTTLISAKQIYKKYPEFKGYPVIHVPVVPTNKSKSTNKSSNKDAKKIFDSMISKYGENGSYTTNKWEELNMKSLMKINDIMSR